MKGTRNRKSSIPAIALEGEKALKAAVAEVVAEHKKTKKPLAVWYDGEAVMMSPYKAMSVVRENHSAYSAKRK
jgi:hypothetical protein